MAIVSSGTIASKKFLNDLLPKWLRWLERVEGEVENLLNDRCIQRELIEIAEANPKTHDPNDFIMWCVHQYVECATGRVRRQLDLDSRSISLARLLEDMARNATEVTRAWYVAQWKDPAASAQRGDRAFEQWSGPCKAHVDPALLARHLDELLKVCGPIKSFVNKRVAHHHRIEESRLLRPKWSELDAAIDALHEKIWVCNGILRRASGDLTPRWPYDWARVFDIPWREPP